MFRCIPVRELIVHADSIGDVVARTERLETVQKESGETAAGCIPDGVLQGCHLGLEEGAERAEPADAHDNERTNERERDESC